jgi:hypothetical protein
MSFYGLFIDGIMHVLPSDLLCKELMKKSRTDFKDTGGGILHMISPKFVTIFHFFLSVLTRIYVLPYLKFRTSVQRNVIS